MILFWIICFVLLGLLFWDLFLQLLLGGSVPSSSALNPLLSLYCLLKPSAHTISWFQSPNLHFQPGDLSSEPQIYTPNSLLSQSSWMRCKKLRFHTSKMKLAKNPWLSKTSCSEQSHVASDLETDIFLIYVELYYCRYLKLKGIDSKIFKILQLTHGFY